MQRAKVVGRPTISKLGAALVVALTVSLVAVLPAQAGQARSGAMAGLS